MQELINELQVILNAIAIIGFIITLLRIRGDRDKSQRDIGKQQAEVTAELQALNGHASRNATNIEEIKHTLGNGGYKGIKDDIQEIKINCAKTHGK
jgi:hypothetical protein